MDPVERTASIGFILQEPFLFSGTIRDNILYGNARLKDVSSEAHDRQGGIEDFTDDCFLGRLVGFLGSPDEIAKAAALATRSAEPPGAE
jgi:ABC-type multidrug transport system fused ATPase/permease subunit